MSYGLEVLNRIDVSNDPVNWIDPWGLEGYPYYPTWSDVQHATQGAKFGIQAAGITVYEATQYAIIDTATTAAWAYLSYGVSSFSGLNLWEDQIFSKTWSTPLVINAFDQPKGLALEIDRQIQNLLMNKADSCD